MFELYFDDLTREAQERFLAAIGLKSATEGNYDLLPIATLAFDCIDEEGE